MTLTQWIGSLPVDANGNIILAQSATFENYTTADALAGLLTSFTDAPTYADLSVLPIASAGGWQKYFDAWKAAGILA